MTHAEIEQTKLFATWCNNIGVAAIAVGIVTPAAGSLYGLPTAPSKADALVAALVLFAVGFLMHWAGRRILAVLP